MIPSLPLLSSRVGSRLAVVKNVHKTTHTKNTQKRANRPPAPARTLATSLTLYAHPLRICFLTHA